MWVQVIDGWSSMLAMLPRHQVEVGSCCIYSSSQRGSVSHATCEQVEAAALGISSRVNCIINPQAVKRQAWQEFTLGPSLSHRHDLALCVRVSDTTPLAGPRRYLRENVISQILARSCIQETFIQSDARMCLCCFLFSLSLTFLCFFFNGGLGSCRI